MNFGKDREELYGILKLEENNRTIRKNIETIPGNYSAYFENVYRSVMGEEELVVKPQQAKEIIGVIERSFESNELKQILPY